MYSSVLLPVFYTGTHVLFFSTVENVFLLREEEYKKCKERAYFSDSVIASRGKKTFVETRHCQNYTANCL